jgi:drug/metabolite transporter (DMT)-like permease
VSNRQANLILLLVTIIWGFGFAAQRAGSEHLSALSFNAARFLLGSVIVAAIIFTRDRLRGTTSQYALSKNGACLGIVLTLAALCQQIGVAKTTTANASFLTITNVVFVPLLSCCIRVTPRPLEICGAALTIAGAFFMTIDRQLHIQSGDWWILTSALFWAIHIILLSQGSNRPDSLRLAAEQFFVCGALSFTAALWHEPFELQAWEAALPAILFAGAVSVAIAYTLQVVAQQFVTPTHAVIILTLEGVFGALAGWLIYGESMSARAICGAIIITIGVTVTQLRFNLTRSGIINTSL